MSTPSHYGPRGLGIPVALLVALNTGFYFASDWYYGTDAPDADFTMVRGAFLVFTGLVILVSKIAGIAPKQIGHGLSGVLGVSLFGLGFAAIDHHMTPVLCATLLLLGALLPVLTYFSLIGSRGAWSFLVSTCAVLALCLFFGAPKVRGQLDIGLWTALIFPGLFVVATVALIMVRGNYGAAAKPMPTATLAAE